MAVLKKIKGGGRADLYDRWSGRRRRFTTPISWTRSAFIIPFSDSKPRLRRKPGSNKTKGYQSALLRRLQLRASCNGSLLPDFHSTSAPPIIPVRSVGRSKATGVITAAYALLYATFGVEPAAMESERDANPSV
jgi:hypothetical protein